MVRKRKPVIDSFHKCLDAFTTYMLVIVVTYPRRALELIKYQQIISRAESKFKGLAWLAYDEQFRRYAASDLTRTWDLVDLELWTDTFSGLAKPHCFVCSSPYHSQADCPKADPTRRKFRGSGSCCFSFNKPSCYNRRSCQFPPRLQPMSFAFTRIPQLYLRWLLQEFRSQKLRRSWQEITLFYFLTADVQQCLHPLTLLNSKGNFVIILTVTLLIPYLMLLDIWRTYWLPGFPKG